MCATAERFTRSPYSPFRHVAAAALAAWLGVSASLGAQSVTPSLTDSTTVTPQLIQTGRKLYRGKGGCVVCHGEKMEGTAVAPAHRRASGWKYARDGTLEELARVINTGVPGTVMVAHPNGISDSDATPLAAYIWAVNHLGEKP